MYSSFTKLINVICRSLQINEEFGHATLRMSTSNCCTRQGPKLTGSLNTHSMVTRMRLLAVYLAVGMGMGAIDTDCWKGPYPLSQSVQFDVTTNSTHPIVGDWIGLTFEFVLAPGIEVTGGTVSYLSILNGFIPYDFTDDLCVDAATSGSPCPLSGSQRMTGAVNVPDVTSLKMTEEWVDSDGNQICCATIKLAL